MSSRWWASAGSDLDDEAFRQVVSESRPCHRRLLDQLRFVRGGSPSRGLTVPCRSASRSWTTTGTAGNRLFYLATPPVAFPRSWPASQEWG